MQNTSDTLRRSRFKRFEIVHVSQLPASVSLNECKETCKLPAPTPAPDTCKLECHSGSPFKEMREDAPRPIVC
ncbi:hypothetical protein KSB_77090 [Ktedonobacter robiniae]|uniref:Uncharacterized protein n=1 Tax=Ktedonobacter robiniae TaxID=2778365 RepID=A0ABQ3V251_9CHLR|nr:hypothetical protein KSB_77090 [Ktedonobacter robiniae]